MGTDHLAVSLGRRAIARSPDAHGNAGSGSGVGQGKGADSQQFIENPRHPGSGSQGQARCARAEAGRHLAMTGEQGSPCLEGRRESTMWAGCAGPAVMAVPRSDCDVGALETSLG
eukprot:jgi/Undpi1/11730/HiC_scaffold_37.g14025.m1